MVVYFGHGGIGLKCLLYYSFNYSNWVNGYQVVDTNNPIYTKTGMVADAIMIISPGGGVTVVAKGTREVVGVYKNVKAAENAIQKVQKSTELSALKYTKVITLPKYQGVSQNTIDRMNNVLKYGKEVTSTNSSTKNIELPVSRCSKCDFEYLTQNPKSSFTTQAKDGSPIRGVILQDGSKVQIRSKSRSRPDDITIDFFSPTGGKKMEIRYSK